MHCVRVRWLAVIVSVLACFATPAHAQVTAGSQDLTRLTLEELLGVEFDKVYGASRFVQSIERAPASVTILSADEITRHGYRTVAEAVESTAGFYATNDRNYGYVGVRGFGRPADFNSRVLVLVDGHRLNDNIYDAAYLGSEFPIDIGLVERIEIIRGPRSSVYGPNAFFAVINVLTRQGRTVGQLELDGWGGSLGTMHARMTAGDRSGKTEWLLSMTGGQSAGYSRLFFPEFNRAETNFGVATDRDGEDLENVFGKFSRGGLSLAGTLARRRKGIPTASFGTVFNDPRTQTRDARWDLDVEYGKSLSPRSEVLVRGYVDHVGYRGDYPAPYFQDRSIISVQEDQSKGDGTGIELLFTHHLRGSHVVTAGGDAYTDIRQAQWVTESAAPDMLTIDERYRTRRWSIFGQDEVTIRNRAILNVGVRYDHHSWTSGSTNPRVGLDLLLGRGSVVKLLYGTAFRAPNAYELFYDSEGPMTHLEPETNRTSEVVIEQRVGRSIRASAALYHYRIENLITEIEQPAAIYRVGFQNLNRVIARGAELAVDASAPGGLNVRVSQTLQSAEDVDTDQLLSNSPRYLTRVAAVVPLVRGRLFAAADGNYVGRRNTLSGGQVDGRYLQHVNVTAPRVIGRLDLGLRITNLFDQVYEDPGGAEHVQDAIIQDGRQFQIRGTYHF